MQKQKKNIRIKELHKARLAFYENKVKEVKNAPYHITEKTKTSLSAGLKKFASYSQTTDPISDFFTRIRNGYQHKKRVISVPFSNDNVRFLEILWQNGFIEKFLINRTKTNLLPEKAHNLNNLEIRTGRSLSTNYNTPFITVFLKYDSGQVPSLQKIVNISTPSQKFTCTVRDLDHTTLNRFFKRHLEFNARQPQVFWLIRTSQGLLIEQEARALKLGGELVGWIS